MPALARRIGRALRGAGARKAAPVVKSTANAPAKKAAPKPTAKAAAAKEAAAKSPASRATAPVKKGAPAKPTAKASAANRAPIQKSAAKAAAKPAAKKAPATSAAAKAPATSAAAKAPTKMPPALGKGPVAKRATVAVPHGSEWTAAELREVRRELVSELQAMQTEYDRSLQDLNELQSSSTDGAGDDQADAGSKTFEREQELSIAANRLDLLTQIQRAVERIDAGTYGFCESCGKPIPKARLKAFPMATLDVACKQREERR